LPFRQRTRQSKQAIAVGPVVMIGHMVTKSFWTTARRVPPRFGISPDAAMAGFAVSGLAAAAGLAASAGLLSAGVAGSAGARGAAGVGGAAAGGAGAVVGAGAAGFGASAGLLSAGLAGAGCCPHAVASRTAGPAAASSRRP